MIPDSESAGGGVEEKSQPSCAQADTPSAALALIERGFAVCRPDPLTKKPTYPRWSTKSLEPKDFKPGDPLGILAGPLSDGKRDGHAAVILDLDIEAAIRLADAHLPVTGMREGRASKPNSHRNFLVPCDTIPKWALSSASQGTKAAKDKTGHPGPFIKSFKHRETEAEGIRLIGTGGQVVCPPSTHPSGEVREWFGGEPGTPAVVPFLELWRCVCELASASGCEIPDVMPRPKKPTGRRSAQSQDKVTARAAKYLATIPPAITGQGGHKALFWAARVLVYGFDLPSETALALLRDLYNPRCVPEWSECELAHKVEDANRCPFNEPRGWLRDAKRPDSAGRDPKWVWGASKKPDAGEEEGECEGAGHTAGREDRFKDTDLANAKRFVADWCGEVLFVGDMKRWFAFDGFRWAEDPTSATVAGLAHQTIRKMADEAVEAVAAAARLAADAEDEAAEAAAEKAMAAARQALAWAKKSQDAKRIVAMLEVAKPYVLVSHVRDVFDTHPHLLNTVNGTVDLRTGALRPHSREDFITKLCLTPYNPHAEAPNYLAFLRTITPSAEAADYLRRFTGYAITGEQTAHLLHIGYGVGSNGKTVVIQCWLLVLGEYAGPVPAELVADDGRDRHPTEKTVLRGLRLATCEETDEEAALNAKRIKQLTGGGDIMARGMRQDYYKFPPTHHLFLSTNHLPRVRATDHGTWRRVRLCEFPRLFWTEADRMADPDGVTAGKYPEHLRADFDLPNRLAAEREGILADMVRQAVAYYANGRKLDPPAEVVRQVNAYRRREDSVGRWLDTFVQPAPFDEVKGEKGKFLYDAFSAWYGEEFDTDEKKRPGAWGFYATLQKRFANRVLNGITLYGVRMICPNNGASKARWTSGEVA